MKFAYNFPPYKEIVELDNTPRAAAEYKAQVKHVLQESIEAFEEAQAGHSFETVVELLDVVHCAETALRSWSPAMIDRAMEEVIEKNRIRGYYG